jgi:hypothetical protein
MDCAVLIFHAAIPLTTLAIRYIRTLPESQIKKYAMTSVNIDISKTGFLPYLSDNAPSIGVEKSQKKEKSVIHKDIIKYVVS